MREDPSQWREGGQEGLLPVRHNEARAEDVPALPALLDGGGAASVMAFDRNAPNHGGIGARGERRGCSRSNEGDSGATVRASESENLAVMVRTGEESAVYCCIVIRMAFSRLLSSFHNTWPRN